MKTLDFRQKGKALLGVSIALAVGLAIYAVVIPSNETQFCRGTDSLGDTYDVRFADNNKDISQVRVLKVTGDQSVVYYEDQKGLVFRESAQAPASRLSLRMNANEKLQIFRECGERPVCRFERIQYVSPSEQQEAQKKAQAMERAAFERRKQASLAAEEFSKLRAKALDIQKQVNKAKGEQKRKLQEQLKKAEGEAGAAADRLHSMSAETFNMNQQTEAMRQRAQESATQVQTTELSPSQVEQWCVKSARPKMKF